MLRRSTVRVHLSRRQWIPLQIGVRGIRGTPGPHVCMSKYGVLRTEYVHTGMDYGVRTTTPRFSTSTSRLQMLAIGAFARPSRYVCRSLLHGVRSTCSHDTGIREGTRTAFGELMVDYDTDCVLYTGDGALEAASSRRWPRLARRHFVLVRVLAPLVTFGVYSLSLLTGSFLPWTVPFPHGNSTDWSSFPTVC